LGTNGVEDIKKHAFFNGLDWDKLFKREIDMPFKPEVHSVDDTSQIDPMFTSERAEDSLVEHSGVMPAEATFEGFTFVAPSGMDGQ
jgi:hypothetical protein